MHTNQTFNSLTIDSGDDLPFPSEIKEGIKSFNWSEFLWNTLGLPAFQSTFSLSGKQLYFESDSAGETKLRKEDFTGQVLVSGALSPDSLDEVYFLVFELAFCNGILCDSKLIDTKKQPKDEYEKGFAVFCDEMEKAKQTKEKFWFKYLYRPYYHIVKWTVLTVVFIVELILKFLVMIAEKFIPIKL
jgi:hypothetical protein